LLSRMPELDHVYALPLGQDPPTTPWKTVRRSLRVIQAYWHFMRETSPDVCLLPRWDDDQYRSTLLAYLTGTPRRVGFSWKAVPGAARADYRDAFLTDAISGGSGLHEAARFCFLAAEAGLVPQATVDHAHSRVVPSLQRIAAAEDWMRLAMLLGIENSRPFAVISPGASMPRRIWPTSSWAEVCTQLATMGFQIVLLSGHSDKQVARRLQEEIGKGAVLVAGQTNLMESAALLQHASLFLGSDSGPGHIAGALGTPAVILFVTPHGRDPDGASSSDRIRPLGPGRVMCCCPPASLSPCESTCHAAYAHCITLIRPDAVLAAAIAVLQREQRPKRVPMGR
jgi:ADP-heptose:LPS heptosyltransferase